MKIGTAPACKARKAKSRQEERTAKPERSQIIARLASLPTDQSESSLSHLTRPRLDVAAAEVVGEGAAARLARGSTGVTALAGEGQDANRARGDGHGASSEARGSPGGGREWAGAVAVRVERGGGSSGDDSLGGGSLRVITIISCGVVVVAVVAVVTLTVALLLVALARGSGHGGAALSYKLAFHDF